MEIRETGGGGGQRRVRSNPIATINISLDQCGYAVDIGVLGRFPSLTASERLRKRALFTKELGFQCLGPALITRFSPLRRSHDVKKLLSFITLCSKQPLEVYCAVRPL
jgi:hypothetical protein